MRRAGYLVLCLIPVVIAPLTGSRALRIPVVHEVVGALLFGAVAIAAYLLARRKGVADAPLLRVAGILLLSPIALIALLWVGLATPWDATPSENKMRYAVLLAGSIGVTGGFALLKESLAESGERLYSVLALVGGLLSGAAYAVWSSFQLGDFALRLAEGEIAPAVASMNDVFDALLFTASALAYVATAALALSLGKAGWIGRNASGVYIALNLIALALLLLRGVSFPVPGADPEPWYTRPGFVVGIPAMPWFMPYFLGVVVLRRAGAGRA